MDYSRVDNYQSALAFKIELEQQLREATEVVVDLKQQLTTDDLKELNRRNLARIIAFAESLPRRVSR
jgi:hypothetical protein